MKYLKSIVCAALSEKYRTLRRQGDRTSERTMAEELEEANVTITSAVQQLEQMKNSNDTVAGKSTFCCYS